MSLSAFGLIHKTKLISDTLLYLGLGKCTCNQDCIPVHVHHVWRITIEKMSAVFTCFGDI